MTLPPKPEGPPPPRRRRADDTPPEESLTTQLFVGGNQSAQPQVPADDSTQALTADDIATLRDPQVQELLGGDSTEMLSLDELRAIARETHDDRLDGDPAREAAPGVAPNPADVQAAQQLAAPSVWRGGQLPPTQQGLQQGSALTLGNTAPPGGQVPPGGPTSAGGQPPHGSAPVGPPQYPQPGAGYQPGYEQAAGGVAAGAGGYGGHHWPPAGGPGSGPARGNPQPKKKGGMPAWAIVLITLGLLVALGIVGYIVWDAFMRPDSTSSASAPPPPVATASQEPTASAPSTTSPAADVTVVAAPSGNITCVIDAERATCVINEHTYKAPAKPSDCQQESWGQVLVANAEGAGFSCAGVPDMPAPETLDYGQSVSAHGMTCASAKDGMSCYSDSTGKGFKVSRAKVSFTQ